MFSNDGALRSAPHNPRTKAGEVALSVEKQWNGEPMLQTDLVLQLPIPTYVLYIYNVGPMEHRVDKGSGGRFLIKACEKGKRHSDPVLIPSIVTDTYIFEDLVKTHSVTGEFMCRDIVHPFIAHSINGREAGWSIGQNLDDFGVFWTKNKIPTEAEISEARRLMERTFKLALEEANFLEATDRLTEITPLMRHAADYFEEDRKWNKIYKKSLECPGCGQQMKADIAVHSCGAVLNWAKAIALSIKSFADAKNVGRYTPELEKEVMALIEAMNKPAPRHEPVNPGDGGSFLTAADLAAANEAPEILDSTAEIRQTTDEDREKRGGAKLATEEPTPKKKPAGKPGTTGKPRVKMPPRKS